MQSVGEAMAIGRTFKQAFAKAMRSRELDVDAAGARGHRRAARRGSRRPAARPLRAAVRGVPARRAEQRDPRAHRRSTPGSSPRSARSRAARTRRRASARTFKAVDTCAAEFEAETPYFYSGWERPAPDGPRHEVEPRRARRRVVILGAGPNRIGQGIEFDYCCVHAAMTVRESGRDAVMVNCNPETVSTDYDTSDRLYFEPLTLEDVLGVIEVERPEGVIVQFGGQTPLKLAQRPGRRRACRCSARRSTRSTWPRTARASAGCCDELGLRRPAVRHRALDRRGARRGRATSATRCSCARRTCSAAGRWRSATRDEELARLPAPHGAAARPARRDLPRPLPRERDRDRRRRALRRRDVAIGGIMQHVEEAGVHSGDSACVIPPHVARPRDARARSRRPPRELALRLGVVGLINIQFAVVGDDELYVIEANPRASRTVPFVSKAIGVPLAKLACRLMLGERLADLGPAEPSARRPRHVSVKEAVLPFDRFPRADSLLGPEMKSTGEVMGVADDFPAAFGKAQAAAGAALPAAGTVFISVTDGDKPAATQLAAALHDLGFEILATGGTAAGDPPDGRAGRADQEDRRGLAERRRPDRVGRRRPRHQHADRLGRARRRLGDPPRRGRARHPVHHDDDRRERGAARDPRAARAATPPVRSLQELHARPARSRRAGTAA